jgi:hypothetical protein
MYINAQVLTAPKTWKQGIFLDALQPLATIWGIVSRFCTVSLDTNEYLSKIFNWF